MTPSVAMITRWGSRCGMDNYVRELVEAVAGNLDVRIYAAREAGAANDAPVELLRDWDADADAVDELASDLAQRRPDVIHVQWNWGYMRLSALGRLLEFSLAEKIPLVLQLHATFDDPAEGSLAQLAPLMARISRVVVHGDADVARLAGWGVKDNVWKWRLGERTWPQRDAEEVRRCLGISDATPVIGTFGFLQPRKNVLQLIQAVTLLKARYPRVLLLASCALHPRGFDAGYVLACRNQIVRDGLRENVELMIRYLPEDVAMTLMQAADVLVLPHVGTAEGTSAAAKFCVASGRPLIVSDERLFDEYRQTALTLERVDAASIADAVGRVIRDPALASSLAEASVRRARELDWSVVGAEYVAEIERLTQSG